MSSTTTTLDRNEIAKRLAALPKWKYEDNALVRIETFSTYMAALDFVYALGKAAEEADHHPDIIMNYKKVTVKFWTHTAGGVTELDFKMAQRVEDLIGLTSKK